MTFDPGFLDSQGRIPLKQLHFGYQRPEHCAHQHDTYSANQTLSILIHRAIFGELKLVLEHPQVHVGVIVSPEGGLRKMVKGDSLEMEEVRTIPVNISYNIVPKLHQSTSKL